jgi:hypothetical protein
VGNSNGSVAGRRNDSNGDKGQCRECAQRNSEGGLQCEDISHLIAAERRAPGTMTCEIKQAAGMADRVLLRVHGMAPIGGFGLL